MAKWPNGVNAPESASAGGTPIVVTLGADLKVGDTVTTVVTDPNGGSYGIMQINGFWCLPNSNWPIGWLQAHGILATCDDLFNATINLQAARAIQSLSGWQPWTTFTGN